MVTHIEIGGHQIGPGYPCFIIAEAGVNHNGSLDMARQLVDVAADAGADAVKFQTFKTENVISRNAAKATYQVETTGDGESQFDMVKALELKDYETASDEMLNSKWARQVGERAVRLSKRMRA